MIKPEIKLFIENNIDYIDDEDFSTLIANLGSSKIYYQYRSLVIDMLLQAGITNIFENLNMYELPCVSWGSKFLSELNMSSSSINRISGNAFEKCKNLKTVVLPANLEFIGSCAFMNTAIESIHVPACRLHYSVFSGCPALQRIEFATGFRTTERSTLRNCSSLETVVFPNTLVGIHPSTFVGCDKLTTIQFQGTTEEFKKNKILTKKSTWHLNSSVKYVECLDNTIDVYNFT